jgi:RHS repeat-associated protein
VRRSWLAADVDNSGKSPTVTQEIEFDALGEHVARTSVPDVAPQAWDELQYDAAGRVVWHKAPWGAVTTLKYELSDVQETAPGNVGTGNIVTTVSHDGRGRVVQVLAAGQSSPTVYIYGPFGHLQKFVGPTGATTVREYDAYGRVLSIEDPDRGTTNMQYNGFDELELSTDALRSVSFVYDDLGRKTRRLDAVGTDTRTTRWEWDTAPGSGIGKLDRVINPDEHVKRFSYDDIGRVTSIEQAIMTPAGKDVYSYGFHYGQFGRLETMDYPDTAGGSTFSVGYLYDGTGHLLEAHEASSKYPFWQLSAVDGAGRTTEERLGKDFVTKRGYDAAKNRVTSILTTIGEKPLQDLSYGYDKRLNLQNRTDGLQGMQEGFTYDSLDRLRCAYFIPARMGSPPCQTSYDYDPAGNITNKSDFGDYHYDPKHPHAVQSVTFQGKEVAAYDYDEVGNQTKRPGDTTVEYTPFDLPKVITTPAGLAAFDYDGDQQRIRKLTWDQETVYFGGLYERVTHAGGGTVEDRYYIKSNERTVAVVTWDKAGVRAEYLHVDNLGSTDVVTQEDGSVAERRSYDAFGAQRDPAWGGWSVPGLSSMATTVGFTGHEADAELGLVNMKGRLYDPMLGRFLSTDPIVGDPGDGQSWNPYSYVKNNPLKYLDPSGFQHEPPVPPAPPAPPTGSGLVGATLNGNGKPLHFTNEEVTVHGQQVAKREYQDGSGLADIYNNTPPNMDPRGTSSGAKPPAHSGSKPSLLKFWDRLGKDVPECLSHRCHWDAPGKQAMDIVGRFRLGGFEVPYQLESGKGNKAHVELVGIEGTHREHGRDVPYSGLIGAIGAGHHAGVFGASASFGFERIRSEGEDGKKAEAETSAILFVDFSAGPVGAGIYLSGSDVGGYGTLSLGPMIYSNGFSLGPAEQPQVPDLSGRDLLPPMSRDAIVNYVTGSSGRDSPPPTSRDAIANYLYGPR